MIVTSSTVQSYSPLHLIITQTSIRAKKRILNELMENISDKHIQQIYHTKIKQSKTRTQLDELAADIITAGIV